jgi:hypothetical protein
VKVPLGAVGVSKIVPPSIHSLAETKNINRAATLPRFRTFGAQDTDTLVAALRATDPLWTLWPDASNAFTIVVDMAEILQVLAIQNNVRKPELRI